MNSEELSRMSQLKDRNIYAHTDQLYEPLRNALRKSSVSHSLLLTQMSFSRVGKNIRSLSPAEAEIIKNNLYIPVNKQLVPTRNLQKVMGKNFIAVDVNENVKQALTPEQFSKRPQGTRQEIIYEIKNETAKNANIYTSRTNIQHSIYTTPHNFIENNKHQKSRGNPITLTLQQQLRQSHIQRINQSSVSRQSPRFSYSNNGSRVDRLSTNNIYTKHNQPANLPQNNVKSIQNQRQSFIVMNRSNSRIPTQFIQVASKQKNNYKTMSSISTLRNQNNACQDLISQVKSTNEYNSKLYDFRTSKVSDKSTKISRKSKDQYKYNLFSAFDEPGNTHCRTGCFNTNEIVASKIDYNPWK